MTAKKKIPTPDELLAEVRGIEVAKTYPFDEYAPVIHELQQKGYSYAKIAEFLQERIGMKMSRGQVYRAYQLWLATRDTDEPVVDVELGPENEHERILQDGAEHLREHMVNWAMHSGYPEDFGEDAICYAADQIRAEAAQQQADERAAEEADKAREEKPKA